MVNNSLINKSLQKPYSDKLLGYLLDYFITLKSDSPEYIKYIQDILSHNEYQIKDSLGNVRKESPIQLGKGDYQNYIPGTFDYTTRDFIYNLFRFKDIEDFTGYIDKDVEKLIFEDSKNINMVNSLYYLN